MKQQFAEFLFKRIGSKMDDMRGISSAEEMEFILDDMETYVSTLKDIVIEAIKL